MKDVARSVSRRAQVLVYEVFKLSMIRSFE